MAFTKVLIAGSAFIAAALAQGVSFTEWPTSVTAGQPATLKWTGDGGAPVTLTLRKGASTDLSNVEVISSDATNGAYTWTPSEDLQNGSDYAFQISQGDQVNYSGLVSLGGGSDTPPPPGSASAAASGGPQTDDRTAGAATGTMASDAQFMISGMATTSAPPSTDSAPASVSASTSASDAAAATSTAPSDASETSSTGAGSSAQTSETAKPSVVAHPSDMNPPFNAANNAASSTASASASASASSSVQTGAAGRAALSVAVGAASAAALLWFFQ